MNRKFAVAAVAAAAMALSVTACSSSGGSGGGTFVVGSAGFSENVLLADIYADALSAKGVKVKKKLSIGERAVYLKALQDGSINFIPEYNGSILYNLAPKSTAKSTAAVTAALPAALGSKLTALTPSAAQDSDTITVTKATADKYHLTSLSDLAPVAGNLIFGGPAAFQTRPDGIPALKSVYGVTFKSFAVTAATGTTTVDALKAGNIQAADIFSTDPSIAANGFVSLADPKNMFAAQNVTPIVTTSKLTSTIKDAINAVSAKLDTKTLAALVAKVTATNADSIAKTWLKSVGLG